MKIVLHNTLTRKDEARTFLSERGAAAPRWDESVLDAAQLSDLRDRFASSEKLLLAEDRARIVERRLDN